MRTENNSFEVEKYRKKAYQDENVTIYKKLRKLSHFHLITLMVMR